MKPLYRDIYSIRAYKSCHEDDDFVIVIREEKGRTFFRRICASSPNEAIEKAFERFLTTKEYRKDETHET